MSIFNNDERIKLAVKSSNYEVAGKFATTLDDIQLLLTANNCNDYNWNNNSKSAIFGASLYNNFGHEAYIATEESVDQYNRNINKIARFNNDNINFDTNVIFNNNIIIEENTNIKGDLIINNDLTVLGAFNITGVIDITGDQNLTGNQLITGNQIITKDLVVNSNLIVDLDETIIGNLTVNSDLYATANQYISGSLFIGCNLNIDGLLTTSNLNIIGDTTLVNTINYKTENLEIINTQDDGPSLTIYQNNNLYNIFEASNVNNFVIIDNNAKLGINKVPITQFDINGDATIDGNITFSNNINNINSNVFNYLADVQSPIQQHFIYTSNYINNTYNIINNITSNQIKDTTDIINNTILDTSNVISERITDLNLDYIADGSINRFIINDIYDSDLTIDGTLLASNLTIIGDTTQINTITYQTENLEIINTQADGPSLKISHNNILHNIFEASNINYFTIIDKDGKLGINKVPEKQLDVEGSIKFSNTINDINTSVFSHLSDVLSPIEQHFTNTSNYIDNVSSKLDLFDTDITDYVDLATSVLSERITNLNLDNIANGSSSNSFIVNNVYDNDLVITGKLTTSYIDLIDLNYNGDDSDSTFINTNLYTYINNISSNIINNRLSQLESRIQSLENS